MNDPKLYAYWRHEIDGGDKQNRDVSDPMMICGFWRVIGADTKEDFPVAIYPNADSEVKLKFSRKKAVDVKSEEGWDFVCGSFLKAVAVTQGAYNHAIDNGVWLDDGKRSRKPDQEKPAPKQEKARPVEKAKPVEREVKARPAAEQAAANDASPDAEPAVVVGIGHNTNVNDTFDQFKQELLGEEETAQSLMKEPVTDEDHADRVAAWIRKLGTLATNGDANRKVEKQPYWDAGKAVDEKWNALINSARDFQTDLKQHLKPWLDKKAEEERLEREAKAKEAARLEEEARQRRLAEEREASKVDVANAPSEAEQEAERKAREEREAEEEARINSLKKEAAKPKSTATGRKGAKVGYRTKKVARINDWEKVAVALVKAENADVMAAIQKAADGYARVGAPLDGMTPDEEKVL